MSNNIPIIVIHFGNQEYLKVCLNQIKKTNPASRIILIGDDSNNCYDFVEHSNFEDMKGTQFDDFAQIYKHYSPNSYTAELVCIQRWILLKNFLQKNNISRCVHLDSDVLVYCNLEEESKNFKQYDYTLCGISPHSTFVNNAQTLEGFCNYLFETYNDPNKIKEFKEFYEGNMKVGYVQGVSDMQLLSYYADAIGKEKLGQTDIIINDSVFDGSIAFAEGFKTANGRKIIEFKNGTPYGTTLDGNKQIQFKTLHFQGKAKAYMKGAFKNQRVSEIDKLTHKFKREIRRCIDNLQGKEPQKY